MQVLYYLNFYLILSDLISYLIFVVFRHLSVITFQAILQKLASDVMQKDNKLNKKEMDLRHRLLYRLEELHKV